MSEPAVLFQNVSKYYKLYDSPRDRLKEALHPFGRKRHREFYALKNVDLEIPKGEILGIVGRNGSGKSTLLKIIAGVIPINSGRVTIHGKVSALLDLGVGMNPEFDGIQNIHFGGLMLGIPHDEMKRRIDDIVAFADIGDFIRQPLKTYSSGMRARLGFALAVHIDPEILVVDEVLAVGDELFKRKCYARMEAMLRSGCTVIYVTHNIHTVTELCTRAVLLDNGELLLDGPPKLVTMQYQKLLFTSPGKLPDARQGIRELQQDNKTKQAQTVALHSSTKAAASRPDIAESPRSYFISGFSPKTTVVEKNDDVDILDAKILNADGVCVNMLTLGDEYRIAFRVRFGIEAQHVSVGVAIRNERGLTLCNGNLSDDPIASVSAGSAITARFHFSCRMLPGSYFVSISTSRLDQGRMRVMAFSHDALCFRVQADQARRGIGGIVYCDQFIETMLETGVS